MMKQIVMGLCAAAMASAAASAGGIVGYQAQPVEFTAVRLDNGFWKDWQHTACRVTVPHCLKQCEATNKINFFRIAAGLAEGQWSSPGPWDDSDVFKVIEGAAYVLALQKNPELEAELNKLIALIAAAQEPDGYLHTWRTIDPEFPPDAWWGSDRRWGNLASGHELYNSGHLFEAAAAHYQATGKRALLDVAVKNADLICSVFGDGRNTGVCGHPQIEHALVRLYRTVGNPAYLDTAEFFLERRGGQYDKSLQGHLPVSQQQEAVGHVVRAMYLYMGMADVAAVKPRPEYFGALNKIWTDIVSHKLYITGAMGSRHETEAFEDEPYLLANRTAYAETCGSIGSVFFNHRLFLRYADARYIDVLERSLYNGVLSGIGLSGDTFSYRNPLETDPTVDGSLRQPWHDCPCCPTNLARVLPSVPRYMFATAADTIYLNLFMASTADILLDCQPVQIRQKTGYPWDGRIEISVRTERKTPFIFRVRIPGWAMNRPVPSDLYTYSDQTPPPTVTLNGHAVPLTLHNGYLQINRVWNDEDKLILELPMPVRRVVSHPAVAANRGLVALERGPLVYCFESIDNEDINAVCIDKDAAMSLQQMPDKLDGIVGVDIRTESGKLFRAIPYYARSNRRPCQMAVWVRGK